MTTEVLRRQTSDRQPAYIKNLQMEIGHGGLEVANKISSTGAARINEPRLGMAIKLCYLTWNAHGRDVLKERREPFIIEVIETYNLFTEIAHRLGSSRLK